MEKSHTDQINQLTNLVKEFMDKVNGQTNKTTDTQTVHAKDTVWGDKQGVSQVKSSLVAKRNDNNGKTVKPKDVRKIAADKGIPINSVIEKDNGDLLVNLPDKTSCDQIS